MKINRILLVVAVTLACVAMAPAQNTFDAPRTVVLATPQLLDGTSGIVTNGPVDTAGFLGSAVVDIMSCTNGGSGTLTAQLYTSSDTTNFTALANYALATSTSVTQINNTLSLTNASTYLLPGVWTTPTASTAGYATPYLNPAQYTNTGAITITAHGVKHVGYKVQDAGRYLYIIWTPAGSATNASVAATLTGIKGFAP